MANNHPMYGDNVAGAPPHPCGDVRDHAYRGGHGIIRIKYIGTGYLGLN